jgi:hypothetical protein
MEGYPECRACNEGILVPFYGPEGHVVYFCNFCRSRFSAYYEDPTYDGVPVFTSLAYYITEGDLKDEKSLTSGELMDEFKRILNSIPPEPLPLEDGGCPYCAGPIGPDGKCSDLCYLPNV